MGWWRCLTGGDTDSVELLAAPEPVHQDQATQNEDRMEQGHRSAHPAPPPAPCLLRVSHPSPVAAWAHAHSRVSRSHLVPPAPSAPPPHRRPIAAPCIQNAGAICWTSSLLPSASTGPPAPPAANKRLLPLHHRRRPCRTPPARARHGDLQSSAHTAVSSIRTRPFKDKPVSSLGLTGA